MTPERWERISGVYAAVLAQVPEARDEYLAAECGTDDELREEVASLLRQALDSTPAFDAIAPESTATHRRGSASGARLGHYRLGALIGEGGMGEVYRARDETLARDVAIKMLPPAFARDANRRARFEREARVLASFNHPHIAAIYGVAEGEGRRGLVLELVEGETLAERLQRAAARGARVGLPIPEALGIARQLVEALDAAHERGIVHRDLKPANIKITPEGVVKVLDFGLATAVAGEGAAADLTKSPTITVGATGEGVILGTAPYMSPEQARGLPVDKRTDIWAFGCVLYELLTGRGAFAGATLADTLAAIVERNPDWTALPADTPVGLARLVRRCLEKDSKRRLRDIGDVRVDLADMEATPIATPASDPSVPTAPTGRIWRMVALGAGIVLAAAVGTFLITNGLPFAPTALDLSAYRFTPLATEPGDEASPSWSPNNKTIVYVAQIDGRRQLFTRSLESPEPTQVTDCPKGCARPFWSPDRARIYFVGGDVLWSVGATGGEPQKVLEGATAAAIAPDGRTLALLRPKGSSRSLWITSTDTLNPQPYKSAPFPESFGLSNALGFSPDSTKIAVLIRPKVDTLTETASDLWIIPYPTGTPRRVLQGIPDAAGSQLSWASDNRHIVWDSDFPDRVGTHLYLVDTDRSTIRQITSGTVNEQSPSFSPDGTKIAFVAGNTDFDLIRVSLDGSSVQTLLASARSERRPALSRSGKQFAYVTNAQGAAEIWIRSIDEGWLRPIVRRDSESPKRLTLDRPSFSPDEKRIVYEVIGHTHAIWVASVADGRGVAVDSESSDQHSPAWSPDGTWIAYQRLVPASEGLWELVKVPSGGGKPLRLGQAAFGGGDHTAWSPAGGWIAHVRGRLRLTSADGQSEKIFSGSAPAAFGFSKDGSSLYAIRLGSNRRWEVVTFDVESERERHVTELELPPEATISGFSLHPDGRSFVTGIGIPRHDIWLLEGFK